MPLRPLPALALLLSVLLLAAPGCDGEGGVVEGAAAELRSRLEAAGEFVEPSPPTPQAEEWTLARRFLEAIDPVSPEPVSPEPVSPEPVTGEAGPPEPATSPGGTGGERAEGRGSLTVDYPHDGSVFPPGFVPPTVLWHDESQADAWVFDATFEDGVRLRVLVPGVPPPSGRIDERALGATNEVYAPTPYQASARSWTPTSPTWRTLQAHSLGAPVVLHVLGVRLDDPRVLSRGRVRIETSKDPVGAPIFYRDVPLMPAVAAESGVIRPLADDAIPLIEWRLRDVTRTDSRVVLTDMPTCANCHSFAQDGKTLAMDVDGPTGDKGAYAIAPLEKTTVIGPEQVISWNAFEGKPAGHKTIGFLSRISPDGRTAVTTLNESLYVANFANYRYLQVFFPTRGILAWVSPESGRMKALPGADDEAFVHCNPTWSPDGTWIVFSRARAFDPYVSGRPLARYPNDPNEPRIRYDLYRMPFREGKGGTPRPIEGASSNGMSNTFPKVSPDGKWIVFTRCRNGQLMRPDGKLCIVPFEGGQAREMRCNTDSMNSWHSFSPNGRWMVFSSKANTPYTQMFLTHLDEDGNDTPPILIPGATAANRAVNIPEFVNVPYDEFERIEVPAVEHHRLYWQGSDLVREGRYTEAIPLLEEALATEPEFARAFLILGLALVELGRTEEAVGHFERSIAIDPTSSEAHNNLGLAHLRDNRREDAARHLRRALDLNPLNGKAEHNLGLLLVRMDMGHTAVEHLERAAALDPDNAGVYSDLGWVQERLGRVADALASYRKAVALDPDLLRARKNLAAALLAGGKADAAREQYAAALVIAPEDAGSHRGIARAMLSLGRVRAGIEHLETAAALAPEDVGTRLFLAWELATTGDDDARNGPRALEIAEALQAGTGGDQPRFLDVLAAACAETGDFARALRLARRARDLEREGGGSVARGLADRIAAYKAGRPWRRKPRTP